MGKPGATDEVIWDEEGHFVIGIPNAVFGQARLKVEVRDSSNGLVGASAVRLAWVHESPTHAHGCISLTLMNAASSPKFVGIIFVGVFCLGLGDPAPPPAWAFFATDRAVTPPSDTWEPPVNALQEALARKPRLGRSWSRCRLDFVVADFWELTSPSLQQQPPQLKFSIEASR